MHPVGDRGFYETEFLDAYREVIYETSLVEVKDSLTVNQGLGVAVAECRFGDELRTNFSLMGKLLLSDIVGESGNLGLSAASHC